eukprot:CAMPEP_0115327576 /NCGR_PEP_ID=MMETSP0270-20121206/84211_1 /TAXON_ID=71861 /ORGANISM="Scrippsiella trochoidea, Strain CCMP3099" /LENGTH=31 /DNA_ID= /DNA_START= /DNA_END= /DNA_ORIENTATION=
MYHLLCSGITILDADSSRQVNWALASDDELR